MMQIWVFTLDLVKIKKKYNKNQLHEKFIILFQKIFLINGILNARKNILIYENVQTIFEDLCIALQLEFEKLLQSFF